MSFVDIHSHVLPDLDDGAKDMTVDFYDKIFTAVAQLLLDEG